MKRPPISFKVLVAIEGVFVAHEAVIVDVPLPALLAAGEKPHPDLVAASAASVQALIAKYNGVYQNEQGKVSQEGRKEGANEGQKG